MNRPALFEPMTLGGLTLRNRVWLAAMCQYSCEARDGQPTSWHLQHLASRAAGGFGLLVTEAVAVTPEGRISPQDAGIWSDEHAAGWAPIVSACQASGAAVAAQLAHAGRKAATYRAFPDQERGQVPPTGGGWVTMGPSAVAYPGLEAPVAMSVPQIQNTVADFARAAARADAAGFDAVEIHAAHGYLLHQFLSPLSNQRDDEYGGSLENRCRLTIEVIAAVRDALPADKPVLLRISATDYLDGGWDLDQSVALASAAGRYGVDLVDVSSGGLLPAKIDAKPSYQVPFARRIREESDVPTAAVGLITQPSQANDVLTQDNADAVLLGRVALREPYWPLRAAHELGMDNADIPYPPQYWRGAY